MRADPLFSFKVTNHREGSFLTFSFFLKGFYYRVQSAEVLSLFTFSVWDTHPSFNLSVVYLFLFFPLFSVFFG